MKCRLRISTATVFAFGLLTATACGPVSGPAPDPSASFRQELADGVGITWPYGTPQDGRWADHPAVTALRESDLALALATNSHDWSAPDLAASTSARFIEMRYRAERADARAAADPENSVPTYVDPGPMPRVILDVVNVSETEYAVASCVPSTWTSEDLADPEFNPQESEPIVSYVRVVNDDGRYFADPGNYELSVDPGDRISLCTLDNLRYGFFDPMPDPDATYATVDVIPPTWLDH